MSLRRCAQLVLLLHALLLLPTDARKKRGGTQLQHIAPEGIEDKPETLARIFPAFLTDEECGRVIAAAEAAEERAGGIAGEFGGSLEVPKVYRSSRIRFVKKVAETQWLYDRVHAMATQINAERWQLGKLDFVEPVQVSVYDASEDGAPGHYDWHADEEHAQGQVPPDGYRVLSISVQLSGGAEYGGGELQVGLLNMTKARGAGIIFASNQAHKVHAVTAGIRKSLVAWVRGVPGLKYWDHANSAAMKIVEKVRSCRPCAQRGRDHIASSPLRCVAGAHDQPSASREAGGDGAGGWVPGWIKTPRPGEDHADSGFRGQQASHAGGGGRRVDRPAQEDRRGAQRCRRTVCGSR